MAARRLLFVDDEAAILRALERLLRTHRREWECAFTSDPLEALELVTSFAPDAVVSDMLMPGLDGAEFLAEASRRRPVMARFILSGEVGAGALVRMALAAHQCLAKPCRGEVLLRVLNDALIEPSRVKVPAVLAGLYGVRGLPLAPGPLAALRDVLGDPATSARDAEAIRLIEGAAGIATKLLQVATWTRLGFGAAPDTVDAAFYQLGPAAVAALLDSDLFRPLAHGQATSFQAEVWGRCARVGPVAHAIASAEGFAADDASRATLVALWSTAAPLLLDTICRHDYARLRHAAGSSSPALVALERDHFGLTASQLAAQLLRLWGLSPALATWVAQSGDSATLTARFSLDGVAHVASAIVAELDGQAVPPATVDYLDRVGLAGRLAAWDALAADAVEHAAA